MGTKKEKNKRTIKRSNDKKKETKKGIVRKKKLEFKLKAIITGLRKFG